MSELADNYHLSDKEKIKELLEKIAALQAEKDAAEAARDHWMSRAKKFEAEGLQAAEVICTLTKLNEERRAELFKRGERIIKLTSEHTALQSRIDALEADRERLDWAETYLECIGIISEDDKPKMHRLEYRKNESIRLFSAEQPTLREAIDAAMRGKEKV